MARFHVQPDGNVARCMAASDDTCPFGGMSGANHYATEADARRAAEKISAGQALKGPGLKRAGGKIVRPNAKNNLPFVNDALEHLREMHSPKAVETRGIILDSMARHSDLEGAEQLIAICDDLDKAGKPGEGFDSPRVKAYYAFRAQAARIQKAQYKEGAEQLIAICDDLDKAGKPGEGFDSPRVKAYYAFRAQAARIQKAQYKKQLAEKNNRIEEPDVQAVMADKLSQSSVRNKMTSSTAAEINKPYGTDNGFSQAYRYQPGDMHRYDLSEVQESLARSNNPRAKDVIQAIHTADQKISPSVTDHDRMLQIAASVRKMGERGGMGPGALKSRVARELEGRARTMEGNTVYTAWKTQDNSEFIDGIRSNFGESKQAWDVFNKSVKEHSNLKSVEQLSTISSDIGNYLSSSGLKDKAEAGTLTHAEAETIRDLSNIMEYTNKRVSKLGHMQNRVYNNTAVRQIQSSMDQMSSDPAMIRDLSNIMEYTNKRVSKLGHMQNRVYNNTAVRQIQSSMDQMSSDPAMREVNHDIQRIWRKENAHYSENLVGGGQLNALRNELKSVALDKSPAYQEACKAVINTIENFRDEAYGNPNTGKEVRRFAPRSLTEAMSSALNKI